MTPAYRVLLTADADLDDLAGYLVQKAGLETALRFYNAASSTFGRLARMPGLGEPRETARRRLEGLRVGAVDGFPRHLVFYRATEAGIDIVRVLHGASDIDRIPSIDEPDNPR